MLSSEHPQLSDLPKVEYSEDIQSPDCPYNIDVNPQGCRELLLTAGVGEDKIGNLTVKVKRKPPFSISGVTLGRYNVEDNVIELFTDPFWRNAEKARRRAEAILNHRLANSTKSSNVVTSEFEVGPLRVAIVKDPGKNLFPELSSGKRLSWYLNVAPAERARGTAQKLIGRRLAKDLESTFAHESKHATISEDENRNEFLKSYFTMGLPLSIAGSIGMVSLMELSSMLRFGGPINLDDPKAVPYLLFTSTIGSLVATINGKQIYYWLMNPFEKKAREFEKEFKNTPAQRFITFSPK